MVHLREMDYADIEAVSTIRVRGWQAACAGIVPQTYLDAMTVEGDAGQRRQWSSQPERKSRDLVALGDRRPVGWICFGPHRGEILSLERVGEVHALYISPDLIGQGIGRTLLGEAHAQMKGQGFETSALWVLYDNQRARRFYERAGDKADGAAQDDVYDGITLTELRYQRVLLQGPACRFGLTATGQPSTIRSMLDHRGLSGLSGQEQECTRAPRWKRFQAARRQ
ncbi:GNAT family N-acetyltransferase [Streptomyces hundungensis]|uniref:GNAT family N-acetyltransferase n=1 Tax=Streptomyces hundungensis TaxID=1077946 RepID=UPI0033EF1D2F